MIKKAEIVTFHCVPNYGAVMQAYALQEVLKQYIKNVEILDYRPQQLTKEYKTLSFYSIFSLLSTLWSSMPYMRKKSKFDKFMKEKMVLSTEKGDKDSMFKDLKTDLVVLGSDQVWNPDITGGFNNMYFGSIPSNFKFKVISYAASMGKSNFTEEEKSDMKKLLLNIDKISVREPDARNIVDDILDRKESSVVVDPTILAGKDYFEPLVQEVKEEPYVLLYSLNGYSETEALAKKISKYFNLKLIELSGRRKPLIKKKHKAMYDAGPIDFISYIANASYVVTDSFHGSVFSLLFHKNILTVPHKSRGSRTKNLMSIVNLNDRLIDHFDKNVINKEIDWDLVEKKLDVEREKSLKFIKDFLNAENGNTI